MVAIAVMEKAMARFAGGNVSRMMACWFGCSPPPKKPCISRKRISCGKLVEMPHSSEHTPNAAMLIMKYRLRPNRLPK